VSSECPVVNGTACNGKGVCLSSTSGVGYCNCFEGAGWQGAACDSCAIGYKKSNDSCVRDLPIGLYVPTEADLAVTKPGVLPSWMFGLGGLFLLGGIIVIMLLIVFKTARAIRRRNAKRKAAEAAAESAMRADSIVPGLKRSPRQSVGELQSQQSGSERRNSPHVSNPLDEREYMSAVHGWANMDSCPSPSASAAASESHSRRLDAVETLLKDYQDVHSGPVLNPLDQQSSQKRVQTVMIRPKSVQSSASEARPVELPAQGLCCLCKRFESLYEWRLVGVVVSSGRRRGASGPPEAAKADVGVRLNNFYAS
jgi:hypothetical protein